VRATLLSTVSIAVMMAAAACAPSEPAAVEGAETSPPPLSTTTSAPATTPATAPATTATTGIPDPDLADLDGLAFDAFLEDSYTILLRRSPQTLTSLGIAADHGMRNDQLDDLSPAFLAETQAIERAILGRLRGYDRSTLSRADAVSYDVYEWFLDQDVRGHRFAYHDYPVHYFLNSYNTNLLLFLGEEHPIASLDDAEDYLIRISQIDEQVGQILERLAISEALGVVPPKIIVDWTISSLREDLGNTATAAAVQVRALRLYTTFATRLAAVAAIDDATRDALLRRAEAELSASFVPAWVSLIDHMEEISPRAGADAGVWRLPDGDAYYEYLLRDHTSTDLTAVEIHQIGLDAVARIQAELDTALEPFGYPDGASTGALLRRVAKDAGSIDGAAPGGRDRVVAAYENLIAGAEAAAGPVFNLWPEAPVAIIEEAAGRGGYYVAASVDGTRPGAFHAGVGGAIETYTMATITYHESVPGHHTQIAIAQELDLPTFRRFIQYNAFAEGWALYAERLAADLGLYADDAYGNIGRLELELLRAARLVVDTGIHSLQWTRAQARDYMETTLGGWTHEVERYMVLPGQATGYMIGMRTILELRNQAVDGAGLDLAAFHDLILDGGSMPLGVLETIVESALE